MRHLFIAILLILSGAKSIAQEEINAFVSASKVAAFDRFTYEIVTNTNCKITPPDFGELEVLSGPSQSHSSTFVNINGKQSREIQYKISYILRAKKEGRYDIEPALMKCNDKTFQSDAIKINVSEGKDQNNSDTEYFLKLTSNKSSIYEGEPFTLTLKYFAKSKPESIEALDLGNANGIWRQDLVPDRKNYETNMESINGVRYFTIVLREELCFAQRNGTVNIAPYYASLIFSQGFFQRFRKESYSNPLNITVKPLPTEKNNNFNGLVGNFSMTSEISKISAQIGEAIDLKITIKGTGNLQSLGSLDLKFPKDFNSFEPKINDKTSVSRTGVSGALEYNYVLIPEHYGDFIIPPFTFSYFDLADKKMKEISTSEFRIHVEKPVDGYGQIIGGAKEVEVTENSIRHIETAPTELFEEGDILFGTWTYIGLVTSPLIAAFLFIFTKRRKEQLTVDERNHIERRKAGKTAKNQFKVIKDLAENGQESEALKALQNTLDTYFMKKYQLGLSDLSKKNVILKLQENGVTAENINRFNHIWNAIEMGQYAPLQQQNLVNTIESAEQLIKELDKLI